MKILHLMLSCFYIDNANYQENIIPRQNKIDGHQVLIIASTEIFTNNITPGFCDPGSYINEDGIPVIRLPYQKLIPKRISRKIRIYNNLYQSIFDFSPDIILFHGVAAHAIVIVAKYKKMNPHVKFLVDSHGDYHNSATNFFSKNLLHKFFYRYLIHKCLPYIDSILYITYETSIFLKDIYRIPEKHLRFFPLGGSIPDNKKRETVRKRIRNDLNILDDQILLIHTGKLDIKKRTLEIVSAFQQVTNQNLRLIILGSMDDSTTASTMPLINSDSRIQYLGWIKSDLLQEYLCASDLYIQLGGQSVTMQNALCCGCAAALYPFESHKYLLNDSVFYIRNTGDLIEVLKTISSDKTILEQKREESFNIAQNILDYSKISATIY